MIELFGIEILGVEIFIALILFAFFCELVDSSLGMGYGTTLTPVLMIIGFGPLAIVPCVLLSELITGITAGLAHHKAGNVNFKRGSIHLNIAIVLASCSIVGATLAVFIAINIPTLWLKTYIGLIVLGMGVLILLTINKNYKFSWGGQILSGVNGNNAVGITSLAEGLTCVVGVIIFIVSPETINWGLAPSLIIGAILSVPFSTFIVKKLPTKTLKISIGVLTLILGSITLIKVFFF